MVKVAGHTHVGKRKNNEDSFIIGDNFAVVADGMGGHQKGEVASNMAVECINKQFDSLKCISENDVINAVKYANTSIFNKAHDNELLCDMGTTVVLCTWNDGEAIAANVGDSRCYLFSSDEVTQITIDHSYVQTLVDSGQITASEAEKRLDKNIILRAAGCESTVEIDIFKFSVKKGDRILLCSDGLSGVLNTDEMKSIVNSCDDVNEAAEKLVCKAYENGGTDNITAVVIMF